MSKKNEKTASVGARVPIHEIIRQTIAQHPEFIRPDGTYDKAAIDKWLAEDDAREAKEAADAKK